MNFKKIQKKKKHYEIEGLTREGRHGARSDGLGGFFNLDKAHTAVASNRKSTMITKPRNVNSSDLAGL